MKFGIRLKILKHKRKLSSFRLNLPEREWSVRRILSETYLPEYGRGPQREYKASGGQKWRPKSSQSVLFPIYVWVYPNRVTNSSATSMIIFRTQSFCLKIPNDIFSCQCRIISWPYIVHLALKNNDIKWTMGYCGCSNNYK